MTIDNLHYLNCLSVSLSLLLYLCPSVHLPTYPSIPLYICPSASLSICRSVLLPICLSVSRSLCSSIPLSLYPSIPLSLCSPVRLPPFSLSPCHHVPLYSYLLVPLSLCRSLSSLSHLFLVSWFFFICCLPYLVLSFPCPLSSCFSSSPSTVPFQFYLFLSFFLTFYLFLWSN